MKTLENIWRRRAGLLAIAALATAANLAFFLWYRATTQDRERALEERRSELAQEVGAAEAEAARLVAQRDRLSQVSSAVAEFFDKRIGPRRETLAPLVEELHTVLRRVGIHPSQISYSIAPVSDLPLIEMRIGFSFRNDYAKFKQLLAGLESDRKWIVVREIGVSRDPDFPGGVQARVQLVTYFAGERPARPRATAARGSQG